MNHHAELISIGNELLSGQTLNTHAQTLGAALTKLGLRLIRDTTIPDEITIICSAAAEALERCGLVFVTGGLGPTIDDITRNALGGLFDRKIIMDSIAAADMKKKYAARGRTMTAAAERQALVLEGAVVLPNPVGAAPGQRLDLPLGKTLFILPGPPDEFSSILESTIIPWLKNRHPDLVPRQERIVQTRGIGESDIVTILETASFRPEKITMGFYPSAGQVRIILSADPEATATLEDAEKKLHRLLVEFIPE